MTTEPKWNREGWATQYMEAEVIGAKAAFDAALADPIFADWYAKISEQVTKTTPGGSVSGDVQHNLFILYFDEVGNHDSLMAAVALGWKMEEQILSRRVYRSKVSGIELIGAENRAIVVRTPPKKAT